MTVVKAKELLMHNPLLHSKQDKYIWISDSYEEYRNAQCLFDYLMKSNIYVKGFATKAECLLHLKMYNKEIFDIDILDKENAAVFYDIYFEQSDSSIQYRGERARIINPNVFNKEVVIWGAGEAGERAFQILVDNNINVKFFVDTNKELKGKTKYGLPVYALEKLEETGTDTAVIETMLKWEAADAIIIDKFVNRFYYNLGGTGGNLWRSARCTVDRVEKPVFALANFWMFNQCMGKTLYIYGCGEIQREFKKYIALLDFKFGGYLVDKEDYEKDEYDDSVKSVEEILGEKDYYIWVYNQDDASKLKELGMVCFEQYVVNGFSWDITIDKEEIFDINLGHMYLTESKYPGILTYGEDKEDDYKIAVLGSSATDGLLFPFKSWPQILYEELHRENVTLYNGAIGRYTSGQELFRLIRDILLLQPDMVLVYDSYGELLTDPRYPFAFRKTKKMIGSGLQSCKGFFGNWLDNMRSMYAISKERGIKFFAFCHPWLVSKKEKNEEEKNMVLNMPGRDVKLALDESFRRHMGELKDMPVYLHDLSHIFDEEHDIYMDAGHVWEKGNRIIAREIMKIIQGEIVKTISDKNLYDRDRSIGDEV